MLHSKHITVSANTSEADRQITSFKANKGVLHTVWATFPAGCTGLVKFRILLDEHPIIPVEKDAYVRGDNFTFIYQPFNEIKVDPARISIETWSDDDTYDHDLDFQFNIVNPKWIAPASGTIGITAALRALFDSSRSK